MIVGISGVAGSGKGTAADFLVRNHGFVKVALADPIKRTVQDVFGFTEWQLWGPSEARNAPDTRYPRKHGPFSQMSFSCPCCRVDFNPMVEPEDWPQCYLTPRYALQQLGTEWARNCYQNVWIEYALRVAEKLAAGGYAYTATSGLRINLDLGEASVVVPDLRFKNEVDAFRKAGAKLVRIVRPGAGIAGQHVSETEQESIPDSAFDAVIVNDGTLEELELKVRAFVQ